MVFNTLDFTKNIYNTMKYSIYILYGIIYLGLWKNAPQYLDDLNYYLRIFVGLVLTITFNPFIKFRSSSIHRSISFSAGVLLLASTTLNSFQNRVGTTVKRVKEEIM